MFDIMPYCSIPEYVQVLKIVMAVGDKDQILLIKLKVSKSNEIVTNTIFLRRTFHYIARHLYKTVTKKSIQTAEF